MFFRRNHGPHNARDPSVRVKLESQQVLGLHNYGQFAHLYREDSCILEVLHCSGSNLNRLAACSSTICCCGLFDVCASMAAMQISELNTKVFRLPRFERVSARIQLGAQV